MLQRSRCRAWLALAALLGFPTGAGAEMCVTVDSRFAGQTPSRALVDAMEHEASSIWGRYGVRIRWSTGSPERQCARVVGSFDVLVLRRSRPPLRRAGAQVLGRTRIEPDSIDHTPIHLYYDATERTIGLLPRERLRSVAWSPDLGPAEIGRALGRVLAHEIGHVLLAESQHRPGGLMRRSFRPDDLVMLRRLSFTLSPEEQHRLRDRQRELEAGLERLSIAAWRE